jgi:hypothetical protein
MKESIINQVNNKLKQIKTIVREVEQLLANGDRFIIRAALTEKRGFVDIYDPINKRKNLVGMFDRKDYTTDLRNISRGIFQSIKMIPLTAVSPGCFDLKINHTDDWIPEEISDEEFEKTLGRRCCCSKSIYAIYFSSIFC